MMPTSLGEGLFFVVCAIVLVAVLLLIRAKLAGKSTWWDQARELFGNRTNKRTLELAEKLCQDIPLAAHGPDYAAWADQALTTMSREELDHLARHLTAGYRDLKAQKRAPRGVVVDQEWQNTMRGLECQLVVLRVIGERLTLPSSQSSPSLPAA